MCECELDLERFRAEMQNLFENNYYGTAESYRLMLNEIMRLRMEQAESA